MPWQQVSPGRYERDFDSLEHFYRGIAAAGEPLRKQQYLISGRIRLKSAPPVPQLQQAWKALRHQYPQIAAVANEAGDKFVYTVPSPEALDAWLQETLIVDTSSSADSLYSTLTPSPIFKLYFLPHARELLFRTPHWRIDGIGLLHLQHAFLRLLAEGAPAEITFDGSEAARLALSLDEAASVPQEVTSEISQAADAELGAFLAGQPAITIATLSNQLPAATQRYGISLPVDLSQRIIAASKARGFTVTTSVHAALVVATQPHALHDDDPSTRGTPGGKYTTLNVVDLRKYLPVPWNGSQAAVSVYHTGVPCTVDLDQHRHFTSIATVLGAGYKRDLRKDEPRNMFGFLSEYVRKVLELLGATPDDLLEVPAHPQLSSLGVINDYVQTRYEGKTATVEVEDWWVAVEVANRLLQSYVWTWNGQLHLGVNYNEAFYERSFVKQFVEEWKEVLVRELVGGQ
ncbi:hypothetical protein VTN96DRAFT_9096 [Rasamsonia emersonii]